MKNKFSWCFPLSKSNYDYIWKNGILTVDANVLLDLYRYHENTRDSLLEALKEFEGTKWLSHQAAIEFFMNRAAVIISSEDAFTQAQDALKKLSDDSIAPHIENIRTTLRNNRLIPDDERDDLCDDLREKIKSLIKEKQSIIEGHKNKHPRFLDDDFILTSLAEIFNGAIGDDFNSEEKDKIKKQAEQRKADKVPPGYLDDDKDGDRPYGDYYLWIQALEQSRLMGKPIIIVTSERKKDWWQIVSGRTIGPRPEMLKEANVITGQRVLIYQTDRFLKHAHERRNLPVDDGVIEEIIAISNTQRKEAVKSKGQFVSKRSSHNNKGIVVAQILRKVRNFTVSGHLDPNMIASPKIKAQLLNCPENLPPFKIRAGTGTVYDFNIHVVCEDKEGELPVGIYAFEYEAYIEESKEILSLDDEM